MFVRISATTIATDRTSPITAGRPPGRATAPITAPAREASSASCPGVSPVTVSYRNGSSSEIPVCDSTRFHGRNRSLSSATRRGNGIHSLICGYVDEPSETGVNQYLLN